MTTVSNERLTFTEAGAHGNCVISPENGTGPYFTLIGGGSDEEQNALAAKIFDAVNALRAQASPAPVSEEMVRNGARGIWDAGATGLPFEMAPTAVVDGLMKQSRAALTAALAAKGGQ